MIGQVPRKVPRHSLETALRTIGYRTRWETFELHGYRELRGQRRFHAKVETHGEDMVPKTASIDLHIDKLSGDALGRHGYEVDGEVIQDELDLIVETILASPETETNRTACPECGKELFADHLENHLKIDHRQR